MNLHCGTRIAACLTAVVTLLCAPHVYAQATVAHTSSSDKPSGTMPDMGDPMAVNSVFTHVLLDQFEGRTDGPNNELRWDGEGWVGTDMDKLWIKSEGFVSNGTVSDGDQEALYDRPIPRLRYFDMQAGIRADLDSDPGRVWAAVGMEGMAPYYFAFAPTFYISDSGHYAGRLNGSYDLFLTQRWIVQPQAELNFYSKDDPPRKTGTGLAEIDTGLRLRYEVSRKFAPYIGFAYNGKFGSTAVYAKQAGQRADDARFVFGIRIWH